MTHAPVPLTIAGSDPTGGAGVEADLKVFAAHRLSGAAVITCLTTQDRSRVHGRTAVPARDIGRRLEVLLDDVEVAGVKTGLLPSAAVIREVAAVIADRIGPLVVDPVLAPTAGRAFLDELGRRALLRHLIPRATVVLPNAPEAAALTGLSEREVTRHPERATAMMRELGPRAVVLKGGHGTGGEAVDLVDVDGDVTPFSRPRLAGPPVHGTGCALSSALLAGLVVGESVERAFGDAKDYVHRAIRGAAGFGSGRSLDYFGTPPR